MTKAKIVNYTPEQTAEMGAAYTLEPTSETVKTLAEKFGKTTRSIIAKLAREKVYKAAEYVNKNGEKPETKEAIIADIAAAIGIPAEKLAGFDKATKAALNIIRNAVR